MLNLLRPWRLTITGVCLFFVWAWFSTSSMDYDGSATFTSFKTAGWFILGIPMLAGVGVVFSAFFALIARKLHAGVGWLALLVVAGCMVFFTVKGALPGQRLARVVGDDAAQVTTIHRLRQSDSFNDGVSIYGVISGPEGLMDLIIAHRGLAMSTQTINVFHFLLHTETLPEFGDTYGDEHSTFYQHPDSGTVYFVYRNRLSDSESLPD